MMPRPQLLALMLGSAVAIGLPILLLRPAAPSSASPPLAVPPLVVPEAPPLARVFDRPLFASPGGDAVLPLDAPQLTGIVGRLGSDAVAMVRTAQGTTRALAPGDAVEGWRLETLSIDAALFVRGGQRARVPLPGGDADAASPGQ